MTSTVKTCTKCEIAKPCSEFYADRAGKLKGSCKECYRAERRGRPTRTPAQKAAYRRRVGDVDASLTYRTIEQIRAEAAEKRAAKEAASVAWQQKMAVKRERGRRGCRQWQATATSEEMAAYRSDNQERWRRHYEKHAKVERERVKRYKHANPDIVSKWHRDRQLMLSQRRDGTLTSDAIKQLFDAAKDCPHCCREMTTSTKSLDHVIPLSRGGWHSISNVEVCCLSCNASKSSKLLSEWLEADESLSAGLLQREGDLRDGATPPHRSVSGGSLPGP